MIAECVYCGFRRGKHSNKLIRQVDGTFRCASFQMCGRRQSLRAKGKR